MRGGPAARPAALVQGGLRGRGQLQRLQELRHARPHAPLRLGALCSTLDGRHVGLKAVGQLCGRQPLHAALWVEQDPVCERPRRRRPAAVAASLLLKLALPDDENPQHVDDAFDGALSH